MRFFRSDGTNFKFKKIVTKYMLSGNFFIDCLATIPTIVTGQIINEVNFLKFLRLRDFFVMF